MKKANKISILCLFIAITFGCNKSSDNASPAIIGKWKSGAITGSLTLNIQGQPTKEPLDEAATGEIVEFKSDGSVTNLTAPGDDAQLNKYRTSGGQLILSGTEATTKKPVDFIFNFKITGSTMVLSMDKSLFTKNIESLSAAGSTSDLADLKELLALITDLTYNFTLEKV